VLKIWVADNFRRTPAGLALISAPLALMVSEVVYGRFFSQESDGQFFAAVAKRSAIWTFATLLEPLAAFSSCPRWSGWSA